MKDRSDGEGATYTVLVNAAGQYSLWLSDAQIPLGWTCAGFNGDRNACMGFVDKVWTDMRPSPPAD